MPEVRKIKRSSVPSARACSTARSDAADEVLRLALDPEVRRVVGDVGEDGDQRSAGNRIAQLSHMARLRFGTSETTRSGGRSRQYLLEQAHLGGMIQPDQPLHGRQLRRAERPAREHQVVDLLQLQAGDLRKHIQLVEGFLQIDEADLPGPVLLLDHLFEGVSGAAMPAAGVEVEEIDFLHKCFLRTSLGCNAARV